MNEQTTPTPVHPPQTSAQGCEHCDDSVPHTHPDVRAAVAASRSRARRASLARGTLAAALLVGAGGAAIATVGAGPALTALAVTVLGWAAATAAGLAVAGLAVARRAVAGRAGSRTSVAPALVLASLTTAALLPVVALAVALTGGEHLVLALLAGAAWPACTAAAEIARAGSWRALLLRRGPEGEAARAGAVAGEEPTTGWARWLAPGALLAACTAALGAVPLLVVVLVPLAVVLAVASARPRGTQPARSR